MAKDYAKQTRYKFVPPKEKKTWQWWLWICVCTMVIGFIVVNMIIERKSLYQFYQKPSVQAFIAKSVALLTHKKTNEDTIPNNVKQPQTVQQPVHFDFYTELPNPKLKYITPVASKPVKIETQTINKVVQAPINQTQYILQLGLFANTASTSQLRMAVLLAGFEAEVVQLPQGYRVQTGPYSTLAAAKAVQKSLEKTGISGQVMRLTAHPPLQTTRHDPI